MRKTGPGPGHLLLLFFVSAAMLALEILLVRLFEYSHWYHFAGLAVSLALLGLGAAGTWLALRGRAAQRAVETIMAAGAAIQSAGTLAVLYLHALITVRPMFAAWDGTELARLLAIDFAAFIPFFGAGLVIGSVFSRWPGQARSIYAANLIGSATGSLAASAALILLPIETALALTALIPVLATLVFRFVRIRRGITVTAILLCAAALVTVVWPPVLRVSDFKVLARVLDLPDGRVLEMQNGLPGRLTVVRSDTLRIAPGLSLQWAHPVPPTDAAIVGSDRLVPVPRKNAGNPAYTDASLAGLPFLLRKSGDVLVMGASSWLSALAAAGRKITWVEPDGRLLALEHQRGLTDGKSTLAADGFFRYLATATNKFTVIAVDTAFSGGDAAREDYLMTVEGMTLALERLTPHGLLALPLQLTVPPRHFPRVLFTLRDALERAGAEQPRLHVAILRGLQEIMLMVSPQPLAGSDIRAIRRFARDWRFDLAWLPYLGEKEINRYHRLDTPVFFRTAEGIFRGTELPPDARWFAKAPATLERPYIWRSIEWDRVPELVRILGRQRAASYLDWSLLLSAASAMSAVFLGLVLILLPLGRLPPIWPPYSRFTVASCFTALGLGYLLLELQFFQRAILFLGEPVLAAAVVFTVFLAGSGIGSTRAPETLDGRTAGQVFLLIAAGLVFALVFFGPLSGLLLHASLPLRIALVTAVLVPLAWALGRPFPWLLRQFAGHGRWVPWAWGINGFASVLAASLATLISVHGGHGFTLAAAAACYTTAGLIAWRWASG